MSDANVYDIGDLIRLKARFSVEGIDTDPTGLKFYIRLKKKGATASIFELGADQELIKDADGQFHLDFTPTAAGDWYYCFEGTGTAQAAEEKYFTVRPSVTR